MHISGNWPMYQNHRETFVSAQSQYLICEVFESVIEGWPH